MRRALLKRVFLSLLFIRFAVPVMLIANDLLYQQFLEQRYQESTEVITVAGQEMEKLNNEGADQISENVESGMLESISRVWSDTVDTMDLSGKLDRLQARAGDIIENLIQLSVVFIFSNGTVTACVFVAFSSGD